MTISASRFEALRKQVEQSKREADRAQGALTQIMQQIKDEFSCKTLEDAERLYRKMEKELVKDEQELEAKIAKIEEMFGDLLSWEN